MICTCLEDDCYLTPNIILPKRLSILKTTVSSRAPELAVVSENSFLLTLDGEFIGIG